MDKYLCRVLASVLSFKIILDFGNFLFVCVEWMRQQILELIDFVRKKKGAPNLIEDNWDETESLYYK